MTARIPTPAKADVGGKGRDAQRQGDRVETESDAIHVVVMRSLAPNFGGRGIRSKSSPGNRREGLAIPLNVPAKAGKDFGTDRRGNRARLGRRSPATVA